VHLILQNIYDIQQRHHSARVIQHHDPHFVHRALQQQSVAAGKTGFQRYGFQLTALIACRQQQAGLEASGTVYVSPDFPEVTYVRLKARWFDWGEEVVRFTTEELGQRICWQGRQYRFTGVDRDTVDTLPEGCTSMGLLQFVTRDSIPAENLHTNVPWLTRHEIFADGQKPQVLYVADTWGEHHQWYRCRLWEDWTD